MSQHPPRDWKYLAEQASTEMDPTKLMDLITELNRVLAERDRLSLKPFSSTDQLNGFRLCP